jgi:hypothetical protein
MQFQVCYATCLTNCPCRSRLQVYATVVYPLKQPGSRRHRLWVNRHTCSCGDLRLAEAGTNLSTLGDERYSWPLGAWNDRGLNPVPGDDESDVLTTTLTRPLV